MPHAQTGSILHHLRRMVGAHAADHSTDGQLLRRFAAHGEAAAFTTLVQRHGRLVWGVCRHILRREHDAEDCFQATFLVLARRAGSIRQGESVGSWLHGVAYRVAVRARRSAARREATERQAAPSGDGGPPDLAWRELQAVLDEELRRLPEKYRAPLVLCGLEGRSRKEAAEELGWKEGTLASRVAEARRRLQERLTRRGVALPAALCAGLLWWDTAAAAVPPALVEATLRAAPFAAAGTAAGVVSGKVLALTERTITAMFLTKLTLTAAVVLGLAVAGIGAGLMAGYTPAAEPAEPKPAARAEPAPKAAPKETVKPADLLKQSAEAARTIDDPTWKTWVLMQIAVAQAKDKDKDTSAKTFAEAIEAGKNDERKTHRLADVAQAQAQAGDVKAAKETADTIDDNLDTRDSALARIAVVQAEAGDLKGAEETIASVSTDLRKGEALRALTAARIKAGDLKEAARTAEGITHDSSRLVALLAVARAHRAAKDAKAAAKCVQEARKIVGGIEEDTEQTDTKAVAEGTLAEGLAEAGDVKEARKLAGEVKKEMWRWLALERVAVAQAGAGDTKGALETAEAIKDDPIRESAVKGVVTAQLRAGDLKGALKTFEGLKRPYWRAEALVEIGKAQAKGGDAAAAKKNFAKALEEADGVEEKEGYFGNAHNACRVHVIQAMAEAGQEKEAAAWAAGQTAPLLKAQALLGVAEAIVLRQEAEKRPAEKK